MLMTPIAFLIEVVSDARMGGHGACAQACAHALRQLSAQTYTNGTRPRKDP